MSILLCLLDHKAALEALTTVRLYPSGSNYTETIERPVVLSEKVVAILTAI